MTRYGLTTMACLTCWWAGSPGDAAPVPQEGTTPYLRWTVASEPDTNEMHDPLVVKDLVIVGTDSGYLRAFRAETGKEVWSHAHGERIFHRPSSDGERVYFTARGSLTAVTADAGKRVWTFNLDKDDGPVLALPGKGVVIVADQSGSLCALDAGTGKRKWGTEFVTDAPPDPPGFPGASARIGDTMARPTALATDGETAFLSVFDQSRLVAYGVESGKKLWSFQAGGWMYGTAVATPTHVFVGSQDECFYCLDKKTGKEVWKYKTHGRIETGGAVDGQYVYFASCDGSVYCLSQADGKERWKFDANREGDGKKTAIYSVPVLRRGAVFFAAGEGHCYALAAETGKLLWQIRSEENADLYCTAATDGRSYFVTTRQRFVKAGEPRQGRPVLAAISLR